MVNESTHGLICLHLSFRCAALIATLPVIHIVLEYDLREHTQHTRTLCSFDIQYVFMLIRLNNYNNACHFVICIVWRRRYNVINHNHMLFIDLLRQRPVNRTCVQGAQVLSRDVTHRISDLGNSWQQQLISSHWTMHNNRLLVSCMLWHKNNAQVNHMRIHSICMLVVSIKVFNYFLMSNMSI